MSEAGDTRLRRLRMRSMRRGIKEMDLILSAFADAQLPALTAAELDAYEALLEENDHDLYLWITGQTQAPAALAPMIGRIAATLPR